MKTSGCIVGWISLFFLMAAFDGRASTRLPTEQDVLRSASDHYPVVVQALMQWETASAEAQAARGQFDTKIVSQNHRVPHGYYERQYFDLQVEKPLPLANSKVYAGYSYGYKPGFFPPQFSTLSTNSGGAPRIGGAISLLRGMAIDERRAAVRHARLTAEKTYAEAEFTRVQVLRDATVVYWGWVSAVRSAGIYKTQVDLAEARRTVLEERFRAGDVSEMVVKENLQYVARRRGELAAAELALRQATLDLSLFWRSPSGDPNLVEVDLARVAADVRDLMQQRVDRVIVAARTIDARSIDFDVIDDRPDIVAVSKELQGNDVDRRLAENLALPKLDFAMDYTKNIGRQDRTNGQNVVTLYFNVEIPLEMNLIRGHIGRAAAQRRMLDSKLEFLKQTARVEAQKLAQAISLTREQMENARQEMLYASDLAEAETYRFRQGRSDLFYVNVREEARASAEAGHVMAQYALIAAHAEYEAVTARSGGLP